MNDHDIKMLAGRNAGAIGQTLEAHGKRMGELADAIDSLGKQLAGLKQEIEQQKDLIHRSLVNKYGTGPTT